jgi:hypothetical protein
MRWAGHVTYMGQTKNEYILVGKAKERRTLEILKTTIV